MQVPAAFLIAWLGPAIGPQTFEVGLEVREAFLEQDPGCGHCFAPSPAGRLLADLYALARRRLTRAGVPGGRGEGSGVSWIVMMAPGTVPMLVVVVMVEP